MIGTEPFSITNDHMNIRVDLNGQPGIGILDTGCAFPLIISEGTAKVLDLPVGAPVGIGGISAGGRAYRTKLDVTIDERTVHLTDAVVLPGFTDFALVGLPLLRQINDYWLINFTTRTLTIGAPPPTKVTLKIGSNTATVNDQPIALDFAPVIQGERTLIPVRFVAEVLGCNVHWDEATQTVTITK